MTMLSRLASATLILLALMFLLPSPLAGAVVIQILHTNDLHAALDSAGEPPPGDSGFGGWAQIKTLLDQYTASAKSQGIETLRLDAGDFVEGTMQYFPKNGTNVMQAYQQMGFDVSTLGNHDWLMGARTLDRMLDPTALPFAGVPFTHPLVSANIKINSRLKNLKKTLQPYTIIEKAGVRFGIFGLSTTEAFYKWIPKVGSKANDFKIKEYADTEGQEDENGNRKIVPGIANKIIAELKPKTDAVIALTHIGFDEDISVVQESRGLDLVVGGHSHDFLETLNLEKDRDGHEIPIVQAGYNGRMIGRIMMEVIPGQQPRVLTYELIPVPTETAKDPTVAATVEKANADLRALYGEAYLNEIIGDSEVRLVPGKYGPTAFSKFAVDAIRASINAPIGLDVGALHANSPQSGGRISRLKLMEMYPRKFETEQNEGLYVYRARIPGLVLALGLKFAVKYGVFASFSGADYQVVKISDEEFAKAKTKEKESRRELLTPFRAKSITVDGKKICLTCVYEVAMPESLIRGAYGITPLARLVVWGGSATNQTLWSAFESHLREIKVITALKGSERFSPRRFSNSYQKKFGSKLDPMEVQPDEMEHHSFVEPEFSPKVLFDGFIGDLLKLQAKKLKIDSHTDADSVEIEGEL